MTEEKHGRGAVPAWQMLDCLAGFGATAFDVTITDGHGDKQSYRAAVPHRELRTQIPSLLMRARLRQHNVIVRPRPAAIDLIQLDDLDEARLERTAKSACLVLATSVGNYQAWMAVANAGADLARRLRLGTHADPSASGAARLAGSVNFKRQYAPDFPVVELRKAELRVTTQAELETQGLLAPLASSPSRPRELARPNRGRWPSYERCLQNAPRAHRNDRVDVSRADFTFCLIAIDWGWSIAETVQRLMESSAKAKASGLPYAQLTAQRAATALEQRYLSGAQRRGTNDVW